MPAKRLSRAARQDSFPVVTNEDAKVLYSQAEDNLNWISYHCDSETLYMVSALVIEATNLAMLHKIRGTTPGSFRTTFDQLMGSMQELKSASLR